MWMSIDDEVGDEGGVVFESLRRDGEVSCVLCDEEDDVDVYVCVCGKY